MYLELSTGNIPIPELLRVLYALITYAHRHLPNPLYIYVVPQSEVGTQITREARPNPLVDSGIEKIYQKVQKLIRLHPQSTGRGQAKSTNRIYKTIHAA